ncbi:hypothetical protein [Marinimicrobium sp. LS-A18]|uniref:hypothetical protein n=1 Tax=Marinimicrobium sp. LS-A18 TaxID=1381596 RepID=UPI0004B30524|nr:hypothetical protein [Marinimicrobium sp. LS-A18]
MKLVLSAFFALGVVSMSANSAPVVESIDLSGDSSEPTVITGQNFGDFDGEIVSWDDFERQSLADPIGRTSPIKGHDWSTIYGYDGQGIVIDDTMSVSGEKAVKVDWSIDSHSIRAFGWAGKGPYNELYITYWRYMEGDFDHTSDNHKQFYLYGTEDGFPQLMPLLPGGTSKWGVYNNVGDGDVSWGDRNNINTEGWSWSNTQEKLQRWEFYTKLNSPYSESNGVIQVRVDGKLGIDTESYRTRYVNGEFTDFRLGHMAQGFSDTAKAWFDDLYIATTRARVEICDSSSYESCSVKHIQYVSPDAWLDNRIEVSLRNAHYFKEGPVYLYVIDSEGNVSNPASVPRPVMN